jgi:formylglycine-generating enzyme required for sulfatase activity
VWAGVGLALVAAFAVAALQTSDRVSCSPGFAVVRARCCPGGACTGMARDPDGEFVAPCPLPLVRTAGGCDAPDTRVRVPEATVVVGPSDWEAEGRVPPRTIHVHAFSIDAFEATAGHVGHAEVDRARAASGLTRAEASAYCASRGGRLPTDDEWTSAAAGAAARRYPWGDTGAVCRRAAWGLASGPCASVGDGPDTVGSHTDGDTPTKIHDMAGNVAEWVAPEPAAAAGAPVATGVARGGSWKSALATELRTWARLELDPEARDPRVGVRCAYDAPP